MRLACAFPHPGNGSLAVNPGWELQGINVRILSYVTLVSLEMNTHLLSLPPSDYPQPTGSYESVLLSHLSQPNQRVTRPRSNSPCANWKQPMKRMNFVCTGASGCGRLLHSAFFSRKEFLSLSTCFSDLHLIKTALCLHTQNWVRECQALYSVF